MTPEANAKGIWALEILSNHPRILPATRKEAERCLRNFRALARMRESGR